MSEHGLKSIVADLYAMRYRTDDIAMLVGRTERRIRQIVDELYPRPSTPRSADDLPAHLRERVLLWRGEREDADLPPGKVTASAAG